MTESDVVTACDRLAQSTGWTVERYEQRRASRICEGLPDRRYVRSKRVVWVEAKAPKGKLTEEQHAWLLAELDAGGLATCIDDPAQLLALFKTLGRSDYASRADASEQCRRFIMLAASRGYRGVAKSTRRATGRKGRRIEPDAKEAA